MTPPARDGSRDRRIEDPSNLYLIHPTARALLPRALAMGVSANMVSLVGLGCGVIAAIGYAHWTDRSMVLLGLLFSVAWLVFDGLDGMIARATGTSSALGRALDGICDHGVFILIYVSIAATLGTAQGWVLAITAGACHAIQSSLYEGERARFHRRVRGAALVAVPRPTGMALVRVYDSVSGSLDRTTMPFERRLAASPDPVAFGRSYGQRAVPTMRLQSLLSANVRVLAICIACLLADPRIFWWFEIVPLTLVVVLGLVRHRTIERSFVRADASFPILLTSEQGHS